MTLLPESELEFTFVRSSGPGGQNVNKVNSKAVLRWNLLSSRALSEELRERVKRVLEARLTRDGCLLVTSDRFRDQGRNREDCIEKLHAILRAASTPPRPRKKTKPTRSSSRKRLESKSLHSEKKRARGRVD